MYICTESHFHLDLFESKEFLDQFDSEETKARRHISPPLGELKPLRFLGLKDPFESVGETPGLGEELETSGEWLETQHLNLLGVGPGFKIRKNTEGFSTTLKLASLLQKHGGGDSNIGGKCQTSTKPLNWIILSKKNVCKCNHPKSSSGIFS